MKENRPKIFSLLLILVFILIGNLNGQETEKKIVTVIPDPDMATSSFYRLFFGTGYRNLWTTGFQAEYLDLLSFSGGLTPTGTGMGMQSLGLRFVGADGRPYTFRPMIKSLLEVLPEYMHDTFIEDVVEDQLKSAFPTAPPVIPILLGAVDVLHNVPKIVVLPDDQLLGEYRDHFAGQLGTLEEWPNEGRDGAPGFAGATQIHSSEELYEVLKSDPSQHVDANNLLVARLVDLLIGDWDRHDGQWRWANVGDGSPPAWMPIPEDRDQAFAKYDGLFFDLLRQFAPKLTKFGPKYNSILGMTLNGQDIDRRFLVGLSQSEWFEAVNFVQTRISDSVIEEALQQLPVEHYQLIAKEIATNLKIRRDKLPAIADKYYRHLSGEVDIRATDKSEVVEVLQNSEGQIEVSIYATQDGEKYPEPYYYRLFNPIETNDVRLFLNGGDDRVVVNGEGKDKIYFRIISDNGKDTILNSSKIGRLRVYDSRRENGIAAKGVKVNKRLYIPPVQSGLIMPHRDWGKLSLFSGALTANGDIGFLMGIGYGRNRFGFRRKPYAHHWSALLSYATKPQSGRFNFSYDRTWENSQYSGGVDLLLSGIEILNFYGYGNETPLPESEDVADVERNLFHLEPALRYAISPDFFIRFGFPLEYSNTEENSNSILGMTRPCGTENFWLGGVSLRLQLDTLDAHGWPTKGILLRFQGEVYPDIFKNAIGSSFGSLEGILGGVVPLTSGLVLAGKIGGRKVWGSYPYYHAAFIGGDSTLRGYDIQRFAGDASIYSSLEIRFPISRYFVILPGEFGLYGFTDVGRVFWEGESSTKWHTGYGAGVWIAPLLRTLALRFSIAQGEEGSRFYFGFGFDF